ncbi:hypothetical protein J7643_01260 [bacterium]|nr:hypothetical protein [bacterium]
MAKPEQVRELAELTARHPEVAVELLDNLGNIRIILYDGQTHPECLPSGGTRDRIAQEDPIPAVVSATIYPRELYEDAALIDFEPIATRVALDEAIKVIEED